MIMKSILMNEHYVSSGYLDAHSTKKNLGCVEEYFGFQSISEY